MLRLRNGYVVLMLLTGCGTWYPPDPMNEPYPLPCQRVIEPVEDTIIELPAEKLKGMAGGISSMGLVIGKTIYLADNLWPEAYERVLNHERCHILIEGNWHG